MAETRRLLIKILFTKISSGAHDDLVHERRSTIMDFKFHLPLDTAVDTLWDSILVLELGTLTMDTVIASTL